MSADRVAACVGALILAGAMTACSTTTAGTGYAVLSAPSGAGSSAHSPSTPSSSPPGVTGPSAVPAPESCPGGTCHQQLSASLTAPYVFIVRTNTAFGAGGATIVELTKSDVPVYWYTIAAEPPAQLSCATSPERSNCVLVTNVGAHSAKATIWRLVAGALQRGGAVLGGTPNMQALDLTADGWVDAAALQSTCDPDCATGKVYWQTWTSDGTSFTSTGCTSPTQNATATPTEPANGSCP